MSNDSINKLINKKDIVLLLFSNKKPNTIQMEIENGFKNKHKAL